LFIYLVVHWYESLSSPTCCSLSTYERFVSSSLS
jgi:hypothetical protein